MVSGLFRSKIFCLNFIAPLISGAIVTYLASFLVQDLVLATIQQISSTVATVTGILFGFVMASVTLLASAKDNPLIQNTQKTKYLPKLIFKLHVLMALLLTVCLIFLVCLFLPDASSFTIPSIAENVRYVSAVLDFGIFVFSIAVVKFVFVWHEFSKFISNM
jgi:hypothetical protein